MQGDRNAVPVGADHLDSIAGALRGQAHALIDALPPRVLVAILPVLERYASGPTPRHRPPADAARLTVHHRRPKRRRS